MNVYGFGFNEDVYDYKYLSAIRGNVASRFDVIHDDEQLHMDGATIVRWKMAGRFRRMVEETGVRPPRVILYGDGRCDWDKVRDPDGIFSARAVNAFQIERLLIQFEAEQGGNP